MKKVALVTGASSGIGKAIAKQLIKDGLTVYTVARRIDKMDDLKLLGALPLQMDITKEDNIVNVVNTIQKENNGVDILINNAGYASYGAVEDTSIEDARRQFEVNLFGLASITQKVVPYMRKKKTGTIVNISSIGGKMYTPLGAWYHATKHALEGWSDCLRLELSPFGVNVVIVEPGGIKTEFGDVMSGPLLERSGNGPYAKMTNALAHATQEMYNSKKSKASPPSVIANVVSKAIHANTPRTRYAKGYMAKPVLFMRRLLSDRLFDKMIKSQLK